jgi:hypothetical protein
MNILSKLRTLFPSTRAFASVPLSQEQIAAAQLDWAMRQASPDPYSTLGANLRVSPPAGTWRTLRPADLSLRLLVLAADMEDEARRLDAAFADQADVLTLQAGARSEQADALYVAADLVRQAQGKIKELGL